MHSLSILVAQKNPSTANQIASKFRMRVRDVAIAQSSAELRSAAAKRTDAIVLDLELCTCTELRELCRDFHGIPVVVTHRSPDDDMWTMCLEAGAVDCCHSGDTEGILRAILQNVRLARYAHAA